MLTNHRQQKVTCYVLIFFLAVSLSTSFKRLLMSMDESTSEMSSEPPREVFHSIPKLKLLFITLEYKAGTFSGNGVYSQSIVRSLTQLGHSLFVISAAPDHHIGSYVKKENEEHLVEIIVPVWNRLDWKCGWKSFSDNISESVIQKVVNFSPDWILVVDWSSLGAYEKITGSAMWKHRSSGVPPMAYLNYRVYTLSEYRGNEAEKERQFYEDKESRAVALCNVLAALSTRDANYLTHPEKLGRQIKPHVFGHALLPPLREDIRQLALTTARYSAGFARNRVTLSWAADRKHLACCVRLSPEKNAVLFADLVEHLASFLLNENIVPLLCMGASGGGDYGTKIKERILTAVPSSVVIDGFMGPEKMAEVYSKTLINVHPCVYDAYGMTVVEAAAFEAPSLVHSGEGGAVGATELLDPTQNLAIPANLAGSIDDVARVVKNALQDKENLARVAASAAKVSLLWSEVANAKELTRILTSTKV